MQNGKNDPIDGQALEWLVRMQDEKAGAEDRQAFEAWLAADAANKAAYERARALWQRFDIITPEYEKLRRAGRIGRREVLLGGLAVLIAAPTAYVVSRPGFLADHKTAAGERRTVVLADGSSVELGSYTALSVDYTPSERRLTLHRGQAFFDVAADAGRPFIVNAAMATVQALGTRFDVKLRDDAGIVSVIEHAVAVRTAGASPIELREGWQVSYGTGGVDQPHEADLASVTAWRNDRIVFEDAPLRLVLQDLERYRYGRIVLMDETIGDMPVTAIFDTRQTSAALQTIERTLPVRIVDAGGLLTIVYRRNGPR